MLRPFVPASRSERPFRRVLATLLVAVLAAFATAPRAASRPAAISSAGMVVSPEKQATRVGVDVLRRGGSAVDAAVAVAMALAVTYPVAGNLGGGGFLLYRDPDGSSHALDFREVAPAALRAELFLDADGKPVPGLSLRSGLGVGVPGTVAGLAAAHERWGRLPWRGLVKPAVRLARDGFEIYPYLGLAFERSGGHLLDDTAARRIFAPDGALPRTGDRLVQKELAGTLRAVGRKGASAITHGVVAESIAAATRSRDGVMQAADLGAYRPVFREPLVGHYRGHRIVTFPPPSSGGIAVLQILGMLQETPSGGDSGAAASRTIHLLAETERRAFADRARWLGDPAFFDVPVDGLLGRDYLRERAADIREQRAASSAAIAHGEPASRSDGETLHVSIADADGGVVSMTLTLNGWFGTGIVAPGTGILLNNEMDDFALAPGVPNLYGLIGGEANAVAGGKRPLSSMTPTLVERDGEPLLVLGSPGGSKIITTVVQVLLNVVDHGMPLQEAVDAPRFHHQWLPDRLFLEQRGFSADVVDALRERGHTVEWGDSTFGNVAAILRAEDGSWHGAADPRRRGHAEGP